MTIKMPRRPRRPLTILTGALVALLSAHAASASLLVTCYLGYTSSAEGREGLSPTTRDRTCTVAVIFKDPDSSRSFASRTYACRVPAYSSSCSVRAEPGESGVPASYTVTSATAAPLFSWSEEQDGCAYAAFQPSGGLLPLFYPITFTDPSPELPTSANPYPYAFSDPMPATPAASGSLRQIIALHYFDCGLHP